MGPNGTGWLLSSFASKVGYVLGVSRRVKTRERYHELFLYLGLITIMLPAPTPDVRSNFFYSQIKAPRRHLLVSGSVINFSNQKCDSSASFARLLRRLARRYCAASSCLFGLPSLKRRCPRGRKVGQTY